LISSFMPSNPNILPPKNKPLAASPVEN
jgi:hypothetical protein